MTMSNLRTFIAVDLPGDVVKKTQQLIRELDAISEGIKWVEPENMHLTLKFLGEVRQNETWKVCQAMTDSVAAIGSFDIQCHGAGAFPKIERPRSIWIGVTQGSEELTRLQTAVDDALADLSFAREPKRFLPHLTIGRVKKPGPWLADVSEMIAAHADFDAGLATINEVVLYCSELTSDGPVYSPIGRSRLR